MNRKYRNKRYREKHSVNLSIKGKRYYIANRERTMNTNRLYKLHVRSEFGMYVRCINYIPPFLCYISISSNACIC